MKLPAPPETLRIARALTALSQREVADLSGITRRYISNAETSESLFELNLKLVEFYVSRGIEFLGQASIGEEVERPGARWIAPRSPTDLSESARPFHTEKLGIAFRAARALLNKSRSELAADAGVSAAVVKDLETGRHWTQASSEMQDYYERQEVEFLGWSDARTKLFYGVGVQVRRTR